MVAALAITVSTFSFWDCLLPTVCAVMLRCGNIYSLTHSQQDGTDGTMSLRVRVKRLHH